MLKSKKGISKIINIVLITIVFFILLNIFMGSGGWLTKGYAYLSSIVFDYKDLGENSGQPLSTTGSSGTDFNSFVSDLNKIMYSKSDNCYKQFSIPSDFKDKRIIFSGSNTDNSLTVYLTDTEGQGIGGMGHIINTIKFKNNNNNNNNIGIKLCAVYGSSIINNFIDNLDCLNKCKDDDLNCKKKCNKKDYKEYSKLELRDDNLYITDTSEETNINQYLFYKPDVGHVCLISNKNYWRPSDCTRDKDNLDEDCINNVMKVIYPECADGKPNINNAPVYTNVNNGDCSKSTHLKANGISMLVGMLKGYEAIPGKNAYQLIKELPQINGFNIPSDEIMIPLIMQESLGDRCALSPVGAKGISQIMPSTASDTTVCSLSNPPQCTKLCNDKTCSTTDLRTNVQYSILGGYNVFKNKYNAIKQYEKKYGSFDNNFELFKTTLAAYNGGENHIREAMKLIFKKNNNKKMNKITFYDIKNTNKIPIESLNYVDPNKKHSVINYYNKYKNLKGI